MQHRLRLPGALVIALGMFACDALLPYTSSDSTSSDVRSSTERRSASDTRRADRRRPEAGPRADRTAEARNDGPTVDRARGDAAGGDGLCPVGAFECLPDGTARSCAGSTWTVLGECPLGCSAAAKSCLIPSNVPAGVLPKGTGAFDSTLVKSPVVINTDTGEIAGIRLAGTGLDAASGIWFEQQPQGAGQPAMGIFSMKSFTLAQGTVLKAEGKGALVLLVQQGATIDGVINVNATGQPAGPGGFDGGAGGLAGSGPCPGKPGSGSNGVSCAGPTYWHFCNSGSGGGGHGGAGGDGGVCLCPSPNDFPGGAGGGTCGQAALVPLVGGSGGAGGSKTQMISGGKPVAATGPGPGGGGGGAIQISAGQSIVVGATGGINAGGGGGGVTISAGGAGGGAGGAILLEAPTLTLAQGSILAANGGGGSAGDCT